MVTTHLFRNDVTTPFLRQFIPSHYIDSSSITVPPLAGIFGDGVTGIQYSRQPQRPDMLIDEYDNIYSVVGLQGKQIRVVNEKNQGLLINPLFADVTIV